MRVIDRVAYINHDIDDAMRAGLLGEGDLLGGAARGAGSESGSERIDALVHDMVECSARAGEIVQGERAAAAMGALRDFMFERVYLGPEVLAERARIAEVVRRLFEHYVEHPELLPAAQSSPAAASDASGEALDRGAEGGAALAQRVTDYLAGMTDRYCIRAYTELQVPRAFAR